MASAFHHPQPCPRRAVARWQVCRTWARLIREAEALWHVDVRAMHRLAALELAQLIAEVPPILYGRVNRWLERFQVQTRLGVSGGAWEASESDRHWH